MHKVKLPAVPFPLFSTSQQWTKVTYINYINMSCFICQGFKLEATALLTAHNHCPLEKATTDF